MDIRPPRPKQSWLDILKTLPPADRLSIVDALGSEVGLLEDDWFWKLRREQFEPPGDWEVLYLDAGRGFGKTLTGGYFCNDRVASGRNGRVALIGPTAADVRDVMVEGPTGILATAPPSFRPEYQPSLRKITWPNGAEAHLYSAEEPERLRGPQHDLGWCDEMAAWNNLRMCWDMYKFGLRLGKIPQTLITTTPKPKKLLREIKRMPGTILVKGITFDNKDLPEMFLEQLRRDYEGTRLGRRELYAEDIDEAEGALWSRDLLDQTRAGPPAGIRRIVVAVDPAATKSEESDEVGLVIAGLGTDGHGYFFEDISAKLSPGETCKRSVDAYDLWEADRIVAEANNGGDWIELGLRQVRPNVSYKKLHASRGKKARAEPVAALFEQKRCHLVGYHPELEDELCSWEPNSGADSPNRLDAMVWAFTELMLGGGERKQLHVRA